MKSNVGMIGGSRLESSAVTDDQPLLRGSDRTIDVGLLPWGVAAQVDRRNWAGPGRPALVRGALLARSTARAGGVRRTVQADTVTAFAAATSGAFGSAKISAARWASSSRAVTSRDVLPAAV